MFSHLLGYRVLPLPGDLVPASLCSCVCGSEWALFWTLLSLNLGPHPPPQGGFEPTCTHEPDCSPYPGPLVPRPSLLTPLHLCTCRVYHLNSRKPLPIPALVPWAVELVARVTSCSALCSAVLPATPRSLQFFERLSGLSFPLFPLFPFRAWPPSPAAPYHVQTGFLKADVILTPARSPHPLLPTPLPAPPPAPGSHKAGRAPASSWSFLASAPPASSTLEAPPLSTC